LPQEESHLHNDGELSEATWAPFSQKVQLLGGKENDQLLQKQIRPRRVWYCIQREVTKWKFRGSEGLK